MSQIVQAIYFAVDRGAEVINMSFSLKQDFVDPEDCARLRGIERRDLRGVGGERWQFYTGLAGGV